MLLKGIVQKTLQGNPTGVARLKSCTATSVCEEMEELEKAFVDSISRLKARVREGEALVASECEHAEQVIESLRADVGVLKVKIREAEDSVAKKDAASQRMEQTFAAKILDLLNEMKKKDASLDSRDNEIRELKSKLGVEAKQVIQLEQALKQAKAETASETQRAEQIAVNSNAAITSLESQMKETRAILRVKDSTISGLEQSHSAKIQDLESQIRTKEKDLADRDKQVNDLRSEVTTLTKGIKEMSSFFKQAEALANIHSDGTLAEAQPQNTSATDSAKQAKKTEAKPAGSEPVVLAITSKATDAQTNTAKRKEVLSRSTLPLGGAKLTAAQNISMVGTGKQAETKLTDSRPVGLIVTSNPTDTSREETVPPSFFDTITRELSEAFGPMASLILRDHVKAVGESMQKFPRTRVAELLDNVIKEIPNETIKISFREHLDKLHILGKIASV
jgi:hypothetical protein